MLCNAYADSSGTPASVKPTITNFHFYSYEGSVALTLLGAISSPFVRSSGDREDVEQLVYKTHLVLDVRLAREAMTSADHSHHFEALDGSGCRLHSLKAPCRADD